MARKGCRVVSVPGKHDAFSRQFADHHFGGIVVAPKAAQGITAGKRLRLIHGDAFDAVVQCARWLASVCGHPAHRNRRRAPAQMASVFCAISGCQAQQVRQLSSLRPTVEKIQAYYP